MGKNMIMVREQKKNSLLVINAEASIQPQFVQFNWLTDVT